MTQKIAQKTAKKRRVLMGRTISPGIAVGKAQLLESQTLHIPKFWISEKEVPSEISRLKLAFKKTQRDLNQIRNKICRYQTSDQLHIVEAHQLMAHDEALLESACELMKNEKINAEWAFQKVIQKASDTFPKDRDTYFQERYEETQHVAHRILQNLMGSSVSSLRQFKKDSIVIAHDLSPPDAVQMIKGMVHGFITESGGSTSHTAIIARAMEIPAISGIAGITHMIHDGDEILLDGKKGTILIHPTKKDLNRYRSLKREYAEEEQALMKKAHLPATTRDGYHLRLAANIELIDEIPTMKTHGAEGVGLFRTEIFFVSFDEPPDEEKQFLNYRDILQNVAPFSATIRTLDIGVDKILSESDLETNLNPSLGLRAIRYCLQERDLLRTQLRAMLRASPFGSLKILIPMVTNLDEIRQVRKIIAELKRDLDENHIPYSNNISLGAMVETPSAALVADKLCHELDFLSIGTNDLIQYTLAVDRDNEDVSELFQPLHPAILRLLKMIADTGRSNNTEVSLCGEMAGDPLCFMLLVGLGLTELSMNPISIPRVKELIRNVTFKRTKELLDRALNCSTALEVEHLVTKELAKIPNFPITHNKVSS